MRRCLLIAITTVAVVVAAAAPQALAADKVVMRDVFGRNFVKPKRFSFSVDGDLVAKQLRWKHWGSRHATAKGTIYERGAGGGPIVQMRGTLSVTGIKKCGATGYYGHVRVNLPQSALFRPGVISLGRPC